MRAERNPRINEGGKATLFLHNETPRSGKSWGFVAHVKKMGATGVFAVPNVGRDEADSAARDAEQKARRIAPDYRILAANGLGQCPNVDPNPNRPYAATVLTHEDQCSGKPNKEWRGDLTLDDYGPIVEAGFCPIRTADYLVEHLEPKTFIITTGRRLPIIHGKVKDSGHRFIVGLDEFHAVDPFTGADSAPSDGDLRDVLRADMPSEMEPIRDFLKENVDFAESWFKAVKPWRDAHRALERFDSNVHVLIQKHKKKPLGEISIRNGAIRDWGYKTKHASWHQSFLARFPGFDDALGEMEIDELRQYTLTNLQSLANTLQGDLGVISYYNALAEMQVGGRGAFSTDGIPGEAIDAAKKWLDGEGPLDAPKALVETLEMIKNGHGKVLMPMVVGGKTTLHSHPGRFGYDGNRAWVEFSFQSIRDWCDLADEVHVLTGTPQPSEWLEMGGFRVVKSSFDGMLPPPKHSFICETKSRGVAPPDKPERAGKIRSQLRERMEALIDMSPWRIVFFARNRAERDWAREVVGGRADVEMARSFRAQATQILPDRLVVLLGPPRPTLDAEFALLTPEGYTATKIGPNRFAAGSEGTSGVSSLAIQSWETVAQTVQCGFRAAQSGQESACIVLGADAHFQGGLRRYRAIWGQNWDVVGVEPKTSKGATKRLVRELLEAAGIEPSPNEKAHWLVVDYLQENAGLGTAWGAKRALRKLDSVTESELADAIEWGLENGRFKVERRKLRLVDGSDSRQSF